MARELRGTERNKYIERNCINEQSWYIDNTRFFEIVEWNLVLPQININQCFSSIIGQESIAFFGNIFPLKKYLKPDVENLTHKQLLIIAKLLHDDFMKKVEEKENEQNLYKKY